MRERGREISFGGQLGPKLCISANACIGPGVRFIGRVILNDVQVKVKIFEYLLSFLALSCSICEWMCGIPLVDIGEGAGTGRSRLYIHVAGMECLWMLVMPGTYCWREIVKLGILY